MTPEQITSYGSEYEKTINAVLEKVTSDHIGGIRLFYNNEDALRNAIQAAMFSFHREAKEAIKQLDAKYA